ncbi:hypothetical protein [Burkholderia stagnalis]|uniref:hypothetical protein n=1 Tax=Burkholderia stagnalis TaxID=1503054 RepID=UPI000AD8EC53|nr:hypothetical protein [Burkholderia stagnalis]
MSGCKPDPLGAPDWFLPLAPAAAFAFLAVAFAAWRLGGAQVHVDRQLKRTVPDNFRRTVLPGV